MNYHTTPVANSNSRKIPTFVVKNGELIVPQKIFSKKDYPTLPFDMVKLVGRDGTNIYIPKSKISSLEY